MVKSDYFSNKKRSISVRKKLVDVREETGVSYKVIGKKSDFSISILSAFVNNKRNLNNESLDRLEPVLDVYLKLISDSNELLRGGKNEE